MLLDDYNSYNADNNKGQRKAYLIYKKKSKWITEKFFTYKYSGQSFLVTQKKGN